MKVAVFGTGGVGGYFGGRLALAGGDVHFLARGAPLEAIKTRGLKVDSILGDFVVKDAKATDDPSQVGEADVVLLGVKAWQVRDAARAVRPMIGARTCILPLQNGVEAADELTAELPAQHVIGGLCGVISFIAGPGHIRHTAEREPFVTFGELDDRSTERTARLLEAFQKAGVKSTIATDIRVALWQKLMLIAPMSSIGAITRAAVGAWRDVPQTRTMFGDAVREVYAVARARGVAVPPAHVQTVTNFPDRLEAGATTSLQRDLAEGRRSELEQQIGVVVRMGRDTGVQTPLHAFVYHSLLPGELQARSPAAGRVVSE